MVEKNIDENHDGDVETYAADLVKQIKVRQQPPLTVFPPHVEVLCTESAAADRLVQVQVQGLAELHVHHRARIQAFLPHEGAHDRGRSQEPAPGRRGRERGGARTPRNHHTPGVPA